MNQSVNTGDSGDMGLILGVKKMPWRRKWQPPPSILAWRIPWTEEPGGLQSMGSQRVRQLTDRQTYTHRVHGVTESWIANTHTHTHTHTHTLQEKVLETKASF